MKRILALVLAAVMLLGTVSLFGCSTTEEEDKGAVIQAYLTDFPITLDPAAAAYGSAEQVKLFGLLYEGLYKIDAEGKLENVLAEKDEEKLYVDPIDMKLTLEITLEDTRWSDGTPVVAGDFVASWKRLLRPEHNNPSAALLYPINNAEKVKTGELSLDDLGVCAIKDKVIQIKFEDGFEDVAYFKRRLASPALVPVKEADVSKFDDTTNPNYTWNPSSAEDAGFVLPKTNGPFKYKKLIVGETLELERNLHYRDVSQIEDNPVDKVVKPYKFITLYSEGKSADDHVERFNKGGKEGIFYINLSSAKKETIKSVKDVKQEAIPSTYTYFFNGDALFSDVRVREALTISLDRDHINSLTGRKTKLAQGFVPFGIENTLKDTDFRKEGGNVLVKPAKSKVDDLPVGDIDKALKLLEESGVNTRTAIEVVYNMNRPYEKEIAEYVVSVWKDQLGFRLAKASGKNSAFFYNYVATEASPISSGAMVIGLDFQCTTPDAYGVLMSFSTKHSGAAVIIDPENPDEITYANNFASFSDAKYDELCDKILTANGLNAKAKAMHEAEKYLATQYPAIPMFCNVDVYASKKLNDLESDMFGGWNFIEVTQDDYKKYLPDEVVVVVDEEVEETEEAEASDETAE